ncbi:MAG: N-acetylmuramoyl-L-alanine amidase [Bacteroidetes bacterium]|nr:N-acetylmuramoyl-L-alanine amidase [Bacteroidota bacterium]
MIFDPRSVFLIASVIALATTPQVAAQSEGSGALRRYPIFGETYEDVTLRDQKLHGTVFYIVSGHGGPDSGARGERDGVTLCEDEYAYDIGLRLTRRLLEHDAKVYVIVRDPDDGIRDDSLLICDSDEIVWGDEEIPLGHLDRLKQRSDIINRLARANRYARYQRIIELHIDSRQEGDRVDVFFYHHSVSPASRRTALILQSTIEKKYRANQPWRGYKGTVASRDGLYMLRMTRPRAVYIELGNIQNPLDQRRFISVDNRQALANWLCEGLLEDFRRSR